MSESAAATPAQEAPRSFNVNLELMQSCMKNVRAGLNKACRGGVFELDEAQVLGSNLTYLAEVCDIVDKAAVRKPQTPEGATAAS